MFKLNPKLEDKARKFFLNAALFVCSFVVVGLVLAWTNPTASPPGGNVPAPINTGTTTQTKAGGFNVSGNVGIGITAPGSKLTVYDGGETITQTGITQALTAAGLQISTDATANAYTPGVFWQTVNDNPTKPKAGIYLQETGNGTYMYLGTSNSYDTGITNNAIVIAPSGNVGIGTTSPGYRLDVAGNIQVQNADPYLIWNETDQAANGKIWDAFASSGTFYMRLVNDAYSAATNWLQVTRSGTTVSSVSFPNGNVGIGTAGPSGKLGVVGSSWDFGLDTGVYPGIGRLWYKSDGTGYGLSIGRKATDNSYSDYVYIKDGGNVGIGRTAPGSKLTVYDGGETITQTGITQALTAAGLQISTDYTANAYTPGVFWQTVNDNPTKPKAGIYLQETGNGTYMYLGTSNSYATGITNNAIVIAPSGNVGIRRTLATNKLEVQGNASKTTAGDWLANSDIRIKTDVGTIENALEVIDQLRPVKFKYTPEYMAAHPDIKDQYYYNFIAQEFQAVFPDSVQDSGEGYLQLDAYVVRPYLVAAVQELSSKIKALEAQIGTAIIGTFEKIVAKTAEIVSAFVKNLTVEQLAVTDKTSGRATILAGSSELLITNSLITDSSKVFVTFRDSYAPATSYWVSEIKAGESFTVTLDQPVSTDARFDYWIVN